MSKIVGSSKEVHAAIDAVDEEMEARSRALDRVVKERGEFVEKTAVRKRSDKSGGVRSDVESLKERCRILFDGRNVAAIERYLNENASSMDGRERYEILMSVIQG